MPRFLISQNAFFWWFTALVTAFLFLPQLLNEGMFFDGLAYSTIASNLANGQGSIWQPMLSNAMWNPFYGHPPLVVYIESFFFLVLGDGWFTERWYCLFILLLSAWLMHKIWVHLYPDYTNISWLPVLLWLITPGIYTFYARNLLEPTMGAFNLFSILTFLYYIKSNCLKIKILWLVLSASGILAAFLCKGFPGLFPLAMPLIFGLVTKQWDVKKSVVENVKLVLFFGFLTATLLCFSAPRNALLNYIETQVLGSVSGDLDVHPSGRFHIVWIYFQDALYMSLITAILVFWVRRLQPDLVNKGSISKEAVFLIVLSMAAAFPVAFSPKQSSFYILASFAPLAIGFVGLRADLINGLITWLLAKAKFVKGFTWVLIILTCGAIWLNVSNYKKLRPRDRDLINDVETIHNYLGEDLTIGSIDNSFKQVSSVHAYFQRYANISLDTLTEHNQYIIHPNQELSDSNWYEIDLDLNQIYLFKRMP